MKLTTKWLRKQEACPEGLVWFENQKLTDGAEVVKSLITAGKLDWANWLLVRLLERKDSVKYAVYAAEQVLNVFEKKYPRDSRPREAIKKAKTCLKNSAAAGEAARAANAAADEAGAAGAANAANAASAAVSAAVSAAASEAGRAADAASDAASWAADAAGAAGAAAGRAMFKKIICYGITLCAVMKKI